MDRHLGRLMEYRADRDAASVTSPIAGCRFLSKLSSGLESNWGFSRHSRRHIGVSSAWSV
ncbi:hypothetical protein [Vreelandella lionensis]|uniref:hypothetical protein n=1 Tax=Vreelandella lionensis TaxID=1144478 RepID=UPI00178D02A6|nr:hypothetical protein [Halomonas lionensis]